MKKYLSFVLSALVITMLMGTSCTKDSPVTVPPTYKVAVTGDVNSFESAVATDWVDMTLTLGRYTDGCVPFNTGKHYGYTFFCLYEALAPGMTNYKSLKGSVTDYQGLTNNIDPKATYNWEVVAHYAMKRFVKYAWGGDSTSYNDSTKRIYRNLCNKYEGKFADMISKDQTMQSICDRSQKWGELVADEIWLYCTTDYSGQLGSGLDKGNLLSSSRSKVTFSPSEMQSMLGMPFPQNPSNWVHIGSNDLLMLPYWGKTRTFSPSNSYGAFTYGTPMKFDTVTYSSFWNMARETDSLNKYIQNNYTKGDTAAVRMWNIGKYWNDDPKVTSTPGGHSMAVGREIVKTAKMKLGDAALALAQCAMATSDAFVVCNRIKYDPNLFTIRPNTYSKRYLSSFNEGGKTFSEIIQTPPFPEWASCHSTQTSASVQCLADRVGDNFTFKDIHSSNRTDIDYDGKARTYTSLDQMRWETGWGRVYGGVHFIQACNDGIEHGKKVGNNIIALSWRK